MPGIGLDDRPPCRPRLDSIVNVMAALGAATAPTPVVTVGRGGQAAVDHDVDGLHRPASSLSPRARRTIGRDLVPLRRRVVDEVAAVGGSVAAGRVSSMP